MTYSPHTHHGHPDRSPLLKGARRLMLRKRGATTAEIAALTGSQAVHSDVHALRVFYAKLGDKAPYVVLPAEYAGRSANGRKVYRYRMEAR